MLRSRYLLLALRLVTFLTRCPKELSARCGERKSKPLLLRHRMSLPASVFVLPLFAVLAPAVRGQVIDLAAQREHLSPIDKDWRFHTGDDAHWADASLDDSAWKLIQPGTDWVRQGYKETNGLAWLRFRLLVPPQTPSLVVALPTIQKNYQLFADGKLIGQVGSLPPANARLAVGAPRLFSIPVNSSTRPRIVTLALRLWFPPSISGVRRSRLGGPAYAGESDPVMDRFTNEKAAGVLEAGSDYTQAIVGLVVGAASLLLFSLTREKSYLWFFHTSACCW